MLDADTGQMTRPILKTFSRGDCEPNMIQSRLESVEGATGWPRVLGQTKIRAPRKREKTTAQPRAIQELAGGISNTLS